MMQELPIYSREGEKENSNIASARRGTLLNKRVSGGRFRWHREHELLLVEEGCIFCTINGETALVKKGQGILIPSGRLHIAKPGEEGAVYRQLKIMPQDAEKTAGCFLLLCEDDAGKKKILEAANRLFCALEATEPAEGLAEELLQLIGTAEMPPFEVGDWETLRRMTGLIQAHFGRRIKLPDIAAAGMVCRSKCCSLFRDYLKTTPIEYLVACRLEKAKALLEQDGLSVAEIAQKCGFDGASYFAQCYRRCFGESPRDTKKRKEHMPDGIDA